MALSPILPICDFLQTNPTASELHEALHNFTPNSNIEELALISSLLKYTVPQVYLQLPEQAQDVIVEKFQSTIGLGNLVSRVELLGKDRQMGDLLDLHMKLLGKVIVRGIVRKSINQKIQNARELEKLLFKGRVYSIVREIEMKYNNVEIPLLCKSMAAYSGFLTLELLNLSDLIEISILNSLLLSLMSISAELQRAIFEVTFQRQNARFLKVSVAKMKRYERKQVLVKFLDFACEKFLQKSPEPDTVAALYVLTTEYLDVSVCDELLCETVISRYNFALNQLVALTLRSSFDTSQFYKLVIKLLVNWGNLGLLSEEPIVRQEHRTHLLLCMCQQLSVHQCADLTKEAEFVKAISARLTSLSTRVKMLGVFFAEKLSEMAQTDKIFNMDTSEVQVPTAKLTTSDIMFDVEECWDILESPIIEETEEIEEQKELSQLIQPIRIEDSDEMEDDPSLAEKPVPVPMYVRDILAYLAVDLKLHSAYQKQKIALDVAPTLLRQKLKFGSEVSFYAEELLTNFTALTNQYEEPDFEAKKLNAMISVVVAYPPVATHLCKLLLTGDYSLQQRMCLLSSLSLGARELRGYKDEDVSQSFAAKQFPSKMLPPNLHSQYMKLENAQNDGSGAEVGHGAEIGAEGFELGYGGFEVGYSRIENGIQNQLMADISEEAQNEIAGGKILRILQSLRKPKQQLDLQVSQHQLANFNKTVGKQFFFPLVAVWYESQGIDIGPYTPLLVSHFIRTLSILLHTAYPAATDLKDMAREYLNLVVPVLQNVSVDQLPVIESIVTGIMLIFEIFDEVYLATNFQNFLLVVESIVGGWWESLIDERVKSLCAGLLLKITKLRSDMERTIMDQSGFL